MLKFVCLNDFPTACGLNDRQVSCRPQGHGSERFLWVCCAAFQAEDMMIRTSPGVVLTSSTRRYEYAARFGAILWRGALSPGVVLTFHVRRYKYSARFGVALWRGALSPGVVLAFHVRRYRYSARFGAILWRGALSPGVVLTFHVRRYKYSVRFGAVVPFVPELCPVCPECQTLYMRHFKLSRGEGKLSP